MLRQTVFTDTSLQKRCKKQYKLAGRQPDPRPIANIPVQIHCKNQQIRSKRWQSTQHQYNEML